MFKLISIDNKNSVGNTFVGKVHRFNYDGTRFYFGSLYSSLVRNIEVTPEGIMIVTTLNSIYRFRREQ